MKKIFILLLVLMLSINIANAQTSAVSDNIFQNVGSTVSQAISSAMSFVVDLFVGSSGNKDADMCSAGPSNSDWLGQVQKFGSKGQECDDIKKNAGCYKGAKDANDKERKPGDNGPTDDDVPTDDVGIANTEQSGSVSKSSDNPNLGISQGIDNTDTGSITKDTNDDTIPISPPISLPKDGAFNNFFKSKVALAKETSDVDKTPCERLKDDQKAAEDMAEDEDKKYSKEEQENAKRDADTIKKAIGRCCLSLPGGGGIGGGKGGDVTPPIDITPPVGPNPPDNPEDPNLPPENPDPILPPVIDRYVCDFSSAGYNNLYNCVVKSGPIVPGELICNINNNLTVPVTQEETKYILGIIPYTDSVTENVTYNPGCFGKDDGVTPPPTGPSEPITPPVNPVNPGDPGDGGGDSGKPPSTPKPSVPEEEDDGAKPISPISCRIPTFSFYDKLAKPPKYMYNLFTTRKIVENPTLEYYAQDCDTCKLVIESEDGNSVEKFVADNTLFKGMLDPTDVVDEKNERYVFEANSVALDTKGLKPGDYIISMHCTDPVFGGPVTGMRKFTNGEEAPPGLKLTIAPEIRGRETVPIISSQAH